MESLKRLAGPVSLWWDYVTDQWQGRAPVGAKRSSEWPRVRDAHLEQYPTCACCGGTKKLRVHHVVPFHVDPERELEPANLLTLCEAKKFGINCHLLLGHLGNWSRWNPLVVLHANIWRRRLTGRCSQVAKAISMWLNESEDE